MANLSALPPQQHAWSSLQGRDDIILDGGILHLQHDSVTPGQARVADLLAIADALERSGVPILLIRHDRREPALAVDLVDRDAVHAALAELAESEPLYLKRRGRPAQLATDARPFPPTASVLRAFRPRITRAGGFRYGSAEGVRLEFWRFDGDAIEAPDDNALMRRLTEPDDVSVVEIERHGRSWRTISGMFDPQPDEFTDDIDMVFSWVDGSSTDFQRQRAAQLAEYVVGEGDDGPARYRHVDELRYALRSVNMYAPWVRRIFIATDSPVPEWLISHPKITVVRSEDFFADPSTLPTHNSHAIEAQLHRIPGLAEHFLYSNDDMFFGRLVEPELFFTAGGVSKFVECGVRIGPGAPTIARSGHDNALRVNRELLRARFGRAIVRDLDHCATPLRRSVMTDLEETFADDFARTAASRFRSATDVSVTNSLYHYYALMTGRAVTTSRPRVRYIQTTLVESLRRMERLAKRTDIDMFCLNDGGDAEIPEEVRVRALQGALEDMFPVRAPWERDEVSEAPGWARSAHPSSLPR